MSRSALVIASAALLAISLACDDGGADLGNYADGLWVNERVVFVSSETYTGDLGGPSGADEKCQRLADAARLPGTFMAWISDDVSSPAQDFTRSRVPYVLVDGTVVADDWEDLTTAFDLRHAIDLDEDGQPSPPSASFCSGTYWVHSGTTPTGESRYAGQNCSGFTSPLGGSVWGRTQNTGGGTWSSGCFGGAPVDLCSALAPIYCFEQ